MPMTIERLQQQMDEAVAALDFETARRCRDMISAMRAGATAAEAAASDFAGLQRQTPGAMGLGTSQQKVIPPPGWSPPPRPDPMTARRSRRGRGRTR
ncbi:excinuclease ABC subunit B [Sphingomonas sp. ABOLD]|nr:MULTISPECIES: UvrB/UvrC motif-containing protein [Sphingomonas]RSV37233.1 excinuclease ABC subunit B [Sphingomonas sp. ABOLE]RSV47095.1 excinuclease ABC subunit B [Sphingomonas sp. ABOLD]